MDFQNYQLDQAGNTNPYQAVPSGIYTLTINQMEEKPTQKGGAYIQIDMSIDAGSSKGVLITDRANVVNSNNTAQLIGRARLNEYGHAVGVGSPKNAAQLLNQRVSARLEHVPKRPKPTLPGQSQEEAGYYNESNDIKQVMPVNHSWGGAAPQQEAALQQAPQQDQQAQQAQAPQQPAAEQAQASAQDEWFAGNQANA